MTHLKISGRKLGAFCRKYGIRKLSLFGSVLRDDFRPESDVDVLVEFEKGARVGFIRLARIERELSDILGRRADINTAGLLSRYFRDEVLKEAQVQYVAS